MWQPPSAGTVAAHFGVGQLFLPRQAVQGPMVAHVAWQLDVCGAYRACIGRAMPAQATFFCFFWEGEIFITRSNDNNLMEM